MNLLLTNRITLMSKTMPVITEDLSSNWGENLKPKRLCHDAGHGRILSVKCKQNATGERMQGVTNLTWEKEERF